VTRIGAVEVRTWSCVAPGALVYYQVLDGGHGWPGHQGSACCEVHRAMNTDIDANRVLWEFFRDRVLP